MSDLFEYAPIEDVDREFMNYVGVHPLSWYDCKEPTAAFVESKYTTEIVDDLLAACKAGGEYDGDEIDGPQLLRLAAQYLDEYFHEELFLLLSKKADAEEAAIARAKGDDDA